MRESIGRGRRRSPPASQLLGAPGKSILLREVREVVTSSEAQPMTVPETPPSRGGVPSTDGTADGPGSTRLDRQEFADLVQRHGRALWALAAGTLGRPDDIEDVLQEAAMIGLQKLEQFERGTSFSAWMGWLKVWAKVPGGGSTPTALSERSACVIPTL